MAAAIRSGDASFPIRIPAPRATTRAALSARIASADSEASPRMAVIGALSFSPRVSTKVSSVNPQPPLSPDGGNRSSCPKAAVLWSCPAGRLGAVGK